MKKILVSLFVLIVLIIGAMVAVPYFFKDKIMSRAKELANENLNARLDFDDVNLSLFRSFPDLYFSVKNLRITGKGEFEDIPLVRIGETGFNLDLIKLFRGENRIKKIYVNNADITVLVLENGKANYDIVKTSDTAAKTEEEKPFSLDLEKIAAKNLRLLYDDRSMALRAYLAGTGYDGKVSVNDGTYTVSGDISADTLDVIFDKIHYLNNTRAKFAHTFVLSDDFQRFDIKKWQGKINDLPLSASGYVEMKPNDDIDMKLNFEAPGGDLKSFMSLIPEAYMPDLPKADIRGNAGLKGEVAGVYNEQNYPGYHIDFRVDNGKIKSPELPGDVHGINVKTRVDFPGGKNLDATVIDLPRISMNIAGSPVEGRLNIRHPMSDPFVNTAFKADVNLEDIPKSLPLKGIKQLAGRLKADFSLKSRVSDMEKQRLDRIDAQGFFNLTGFLFRSDSLPVPVKISQLKTSVKPVEWQVDTWKMQIGKSDFDIHGGVQNYLAYFPGKDSLLRARFFNTSRVIDFNELTALQGDDQSQADTTSLKAIRIPAGLDIRLKADADEVIYSDMHLRDVKADVVVRNRKAELSGILMKAFGGEMKLTGTYDSSKEKPYSGLRLKMQKARLDQAAGTLSLMQRYAPVLAQIKGLFNLDLQTGLSLDENMQPVYSTVDAEGLMSTGVIKPENAGFLKKVAGILKLKALQNPEIKSAKAQFRIEDGMMKVKPFDIKINQIDSKLGGTVSLDRKLDFNWDMVIPVKMLGKEAGKWISQFSGKLASIGVNPGKLEKVYVTLRITGDIMHPVIRPVFRKGAGMQGLEETVKETVKQQVQQAVDSAKTVVNRKAQQLITEAGKRGDALIAEAQKQAERIKAEADKRAEEIIKKARNPLEKFAAKKLAEKVKQKAYKRADELVEKARRQKEKWVEEAKKKAASLTK